MAVNWKEYVKVDPRLLETPEGRRAATKTNPLLFALVYLPHHLRNDDGEISFAECHIEWCEIAKKWMKSSPQPREHRHAFLAPRSTGKSTWWFTLLPLWWAAHGHSKFIAAFADSGGMAELHLATFKTELESNELLNQDFPELCNAGKRKRGTIQGDAKNIRISESGFVFMAKGIDSTSLGMKIGTRRPDTLLLDDIEPDESNYSTYQMEQRLITLQDAILPLNERARVALSGTVTMPGSITHQLVKYGANPALALDPMENLEWILSEKFKVHHAKPIIRDDEDNERSLWPEKWSLEFLLENRHSRSFKKNYENNPMAVDAEYWRDEDFTHGDIPNCTQTVLTIDGAVTTKAKSDFTGLAVVGYCPSWQTLTSMNGPLATALLSAVDVMTKNNTKQPARCVVKWARAVKLQGNELRKYVLNVLDSFPEIRSILVETNQGGDMWLDVLHGMPVPIYTVHNTEKKESRAGRLLNLYQLIPTRVLHAEKLPALEEQMVSFPKGANDDLVDAVGNAVLRFLRPEKRKKARFRTLHQK